MAGKRSERLLSVASDLESFTSAFGGGVNIIMEIIRRLSFLFPAEAKGVIDRLPIFKRSAPIRNRKLGYRRGSGRVLRQDCVSSLKIVDRSTRM